MSDVLFSDISEFQRVVNNDYPYAFIAFRSNDGTYRDHHFAQNLAWAKQRVAEGKLRGFIVYLVWEYDWQETVATFKSMVGTPHPKMAVMIDMESWKGRITGNQSAGANAVREEIISWLNSHRGGPLRQRLYRSRDRKRVFGYGNAYDLASLWPNRGDMQVTLANYSSNPSTPKHLIHQFSDRFSVPPFGPSDINSADGLSPAQFEKALGLDSYVSQPKPPVVVPGWPLKPNEFFGPHPHYNGWGTTVHNHQVRSIQLQLIKHGFAGRVSTTWADGHYGPSTVAAVNRFRKSKHWSQNGLVGRFAWAALFKLG